MQINFQSKRQDWKEMLCYSQPHPSLFPDLQWEEEAGKQLEVHLRGPL